MTIKVTVNDEEKEINLDGVSISVSHLKIGSDIYFKDISEISFNENNFIMQMVDGIKDCCILSLEQYGNNIKLSTYKVELWKLKTIIQN